VDVGARQRPAGLVDDHTRDIRCVSGRGQSALAEGGGVASATGRTWQ